MSHKYILIHSYQRPLTLTSVLSYLTDVRVKVLSYLNDVSVKVLSYLNDDVIVGELYSSRETTGLTVLSRRWFSYYDFPTLQTVYNVG